MDIKHLVWDSDFFKMKVGRVDCPVLSDQILDEIKQSAGINRYQLIYVYCKEKSLQFNRPGLNLADEKVEFVFPVEEKEYIVSDQIKEYMSDKITDDLYSLAIQSGQYSRFKLDTDFPSGSFEELYRIWMERSVSGEIADKVWVFEEADRNIGMVTLKVNDRKAVIGLISVDQVSRGKKVGTFLLEMVKNHARLLDLDHVYVTTQLTNTQACSFYQKNGFKIDNIQYIYHLWM